MVDDEMQEEYEAKVSFLDAFYNIPTVKLNLRLVVSLVRPICLGRRHCDRHPP